VTKRKEKRFDESRDSEYVERRNKIRDSWSIDTELNRRAYYCVMWVGDRFVSGGWFPDTCDVLIDSRKSIYSDESNQSDYWQEGLG
jgi:hypothetical protein